MTVSRDATPSPQSEETSCSGSILGYFSRGEWVFVTLLLLTGVFLRWILLGDRPLHHDESIHVMFGRYFFDFPDIQFYKYNPEYHGPLLYTFLRGMYLSFGDTEWSARALINIMGTSYLFVPILFRRYLSKLAVLGLTLFIAVSPTLVYWSRFVREDLFVVTGMLFMLYGVLLAPARRKSLLVFLGIVFQWCSKENSYVTMALFYGYAVFEYLFRVLIYKEKRDPFPFTFLAPVVFAAGVYLQYGRSMEHLMDVGAVAALFCIGIDALVPRWGAIDGGPKSLIGKMYLHIENYRREFLGSFLFAALLFSWLYSAGFRYIQGILDGLYRAGITFWLEKHSIERIKGPFLFHIYQLTWYEFLFMCAVVVHLVLLFKRSASWEKVCQGAMYAVSLSCTVYFLFWRPQEYGGFWEIFKAKDALDCGAIIILLVYPLLVTIHHLLRREESLALWAYLFSASLFTYSYLGEKVPWLSLYPFVAGLIYLPLFFERWLKDECDDFDGYQPWSKLFLFAGYVALVIGLLFVLEDKAEGNLSLLVLGLLLVAAGFLDGRVFHFGRFNVFVALGSFIFCFNLRATTLANYEWRQHEIGFISQVHTTREVVKIAHRVRSEVESSQGGRKKTLLVGGDAVWPLTWYFRDLPEYKFSATPDERVKFDYIFQDYKEESPDVPPGFTATKVNLRGWWVPEYDKMNFKKFLNYAINQIPWNGTGYTYIHLLTRKTDDVGK